MKSQIMWLWFWKPRHDFSLCCAHFILSRSSVLVRNVFSDKTSGSQRCFIPYYITHLHLPTSSLLLYHCCTIYSSLVLGWKGWKRIAMGVDACLCFMFPSAMCVDFLAYSSQFKGKENYLRKMNSLIYQFPLAPGPRINLVQYEFPKFDFCVTLFRMHMYISKHLVQVHL